MTKKERDIMPYGETKVYFDGSHYIAIPHTEKPYKRRPKKIEEVITVADDGKTLAPVEEKAESPPVEEKQMTLEDLAEETQETSEENTSPPKPVKTVKATKKQVFDTDGRKRRKRTVGKRLHGKC